MWRDIERRAAMYGLPISLPVPYPAQQSIIANLVAIVGMRQGWGIDFVRTAYRRWFQLGQETGSEPNVSESLRDIGQEPQSILALANAAEARDTLKAETEAAKQLGIFGSPTFVVGRELFWGDDRRGDAMSWYKRSRGGLAAAELSPATTPRNTHVTEPMDFPEPDSLGGQGPLPGGRNAA